MQTLVTAQFSLKEVNLDQFLIAYYFSNYVSKIILLVSIEKDEKHSVEKEEG